jgi:hypothetical protein
MALKGNPEAKGKKLAELYSPATFKLVDLLNLVIQLMEVAEIKGDMGLSPEECKELVTIQLSSFLKHLGPIPWADEQSLTDMANVFIDIICAAAKGSFAINKEGRNNAT